MTSETNEHPDVLAMKSIVERLMSNAQDTKNLIDILEQEHEKLMRTEITIRNVRGSILEAIEFAERTN